MTHSDDDLYVPIDISHLPDDFATRFAEMFKGIVNYSPEKVQIITTENPSINSTSNTTRKKPKLRIIPAYPAPEIPNAASLISQVTHNFGYVDNVFEIFFNSNRNRGSIQIESTLKKKIIDTAIETGRSTNSIMRGALRRAFPDSWASEKERLEYEEKNNGIGSGDITKIRSLDIDGPKRLNGYDLDSKYAQRLINSVKDTHKSRINFKLPQDLMDYLQNS